MTARARGEYRFATRSGPGRARGAPCPWLPRRSHGPEIYPPRLPRHRHKGHEHMQRLEKALQARAHRRAEHPPPRRAVRALSASTSAGTTPAPDPAHGESPRECMSLICDTCREYAKNFGKGSGQSHLHGRPRPGKTPFRPGWWRSAAAPWPMNHAAAALSAFE